LGLRDGDCCSNSHDADREQTMNSTVLGFASVILGAIALAPLLVQTDQISPRAFETPALASSDPGHARSVDRARLSEPDAGRHPTVPDASSTGFRIVAAR
jgi:hypothetical protein